MSKIQIPNSETVKKALKQADRRIKTVIKKINLEAAKHTKGGNYDGADKWISVAKTVMDYQSRLNAFMDEWQTIVKTSKIAANSNKKEPKGELKRTPPWKLYTPLLEALSEKGGQAHIKDLILSVDKKIKGELKKRDLEINKNKGVPKWQATAMGLSSRLRREGWVKIDKDKQLILTEDGAEMIKKQGKD